MFKKNEQGNSDLRGAIDRKAIKIVILQWTKGKSQQKSQVNDFVGRSKTKKLKHGQNEHLNGGFLATMEIYFFWGVEPSRRNYNIYVITFVMKFSRPKEPIRLIWNITYF